ncbi:SUMF1/EgtB/PvdO family nonheme iron enzyme, partial [Chitinispirillales bacterium ANBcel5]|uniref:SUMF1/EgtB/PvdO family nonheme iron enzyme n=1 Tax=Cellulosispirillum alkaliphilum TaxID=3039283 RepID=UPI002A543DA5|nr:SUMF1/EgtB/PvdO family nonheme iron enzyme [Chitinispirillales bacterium ANBcel5]
VSEPDSLPVKDGYRFVGWYTTESDEPYNFSTPVTDDFSLYAQWNELFSVTYDENGGAGTVPVDTQKYITGETVTVLGDTLNKGGHIFRGWKHDGTTYNEGDTFSMGSEDVTLSAVWEKEMFTVTFRDEDGDRLSTENVVFQDTVPRPVDPEKEGFVFDEWLHEGLPFVFDTPIVDDITLTASWNIAPPQITLQPRNQTVFAGRRDVEFSIEASGVGILNYQWSVNGEEIPGETSSLLSIPQVNRNNNGDSFKCIVSNEGGAVTSNEVTLTVNRGPWVPQPEELEHDNGMVLIRADGYSFRMGNPTTDPWVDFSYDFWMSEAEITQGEYAEIMSNHIPNFIPPRWAFYRDDNKPAYTLTWYDAVLYCWARNVEEGLEQVYSFDGIIWDEVSWSSSIGFENLEIDTSKNGYRLPVGAEWEYAARGGTNTRFSWGGNHQYYPLTSADTAEINEHAAWEANSGRNHGPHIVKGREPNRYGVYDMGGNVWEWYKTDDFDGYNARGGSWNSREATLLMPNSTIGFTSGYRNDHLGFRVMRKAPD